MPCRHEMGDASLRATRISPIREMTAVLPFQLPNNAARRIAVFSSSSLQIQARDCKLLLVDAAGTERRKDQSQHSRERAEETQEINASLFSLKECVRQRNAASNGSGPPAHIYRGSNLTKILADSLKPSGSCLLDGCIRLGFKCMCLTTPLFYGTL